MWIKRAEVFNLVAQVSQAEQKAATTGEQLAYLKSHLEWFSHRVTQLERERAQLMYTYAGIKLPTPEYSTTPQPSVAEILNAVPSFDDPGDKEAGRLGITHSETGELVYRN